jgi:UDP-glucose 4-epimerase
MRSLFGSNILVTGGAGFIGSHLVDRLITEGANKVVVVDNMFLGSVDNLIRAIDNGVKLYENNAEDYSFMKYVLTNYKIDTVFNLATKALNYSFVNPVDCFKTNVDVMLNLLELQRERWFKTLCHFSTSEVYGTAIYEPIDEKHPKNPTTLYASGKLSADFILENYVNIYGLDAFIVRPFNNYGPRQNHKGYMAGIIPTTIWRINFRLNPVIHGDGNQTRSLIYVEDTVEATIKLFDKIKPGDCVNVSNSGKHTVKSIVKEIAACMKVDVVPFYTDQRIADVKCHNADISKMKSLIDIELTPFNLGLVKTIQWYMENL